MQVWRKTIESEKLANIGDISTECYGKNNIEEYHNIARMTAQINARNPFRATLDKRTQQHTAQISKYHGTSIEN
jgi:hypothetical protein